MLPRCHFQRPSQRTSARQSHKCRYGNRFRQTPLQLFDHNSAKSLENEPNTSSLVSGQVGNPSAGFDSTEGRDSPGVRSERFEGGAVRHKDCGTQCRVG